MSETKGVVHSQEVQSSTKKRDVRTLRQKFRALLRDPEFLMIFFFVIGVSYFIFIAVPLFGELSLILLTIIYNSIVKKENQCFDFPYRLPIHSDVYDGSTPGGKSKGKGITLLGTDLENHEQIYAADPDLRTHSLVLGTTGSGKTEYLLGLFFNALIQNSGCIYVDGKGDPKLQKEVFRLSRIMGRVSDLLIINFITSGRDFVDKQTDKVTNTLNMMANTSSGMLIELIVGLMDSSGGGGDMWKGRAISFVAAITRPLVYLRDKGFINLSPETYLSYFELHVLEELVFEHGGKYGQKFDVIAAPLRNYLVTLPGYQNTPEKRKKQETKTLEQHGFIVMQLTRIFNDLTFNYGHIFKVRRGDVDFYDVVINRRLLIVLLPALENSPDSLQMLGKLIVGSIKQMMAGCLGNRVEGVVREIIDSRPTNAKYPFYTILDEYGYYAVLGFAVAPAQARSLGFSVTFAAQDFSSLKKSSAEEADATWENTNIRVFGRLTSGEESETWKRINGAASSAVEAEMPNFSRKTGLISDRHILADSVQLSQKQRVHYDDFAKQENGDFTFVIGKKESKGQGGGVRIIRGRGFYTATKSPKEMRLNDFVPVIPPEPQELPQVFIDLKAITTFLSEKTLKKALDPFIDILPILTSFTNLSLLNKHLYDSKNTDHALISRDLSCAQIGMYLAEGNCEFTFTPPSPALTVVETEIITSVDQPSDSSEIDIKDEPLLTTVELMQKAEESDDKHSPSIEVSDAYSIGGEATSVSVVAPPLDTEKVTLDIDVFFSAATELCSEIEEINDFSDVTLDTDVSIFAEQRRLTDEDQRNFNRLHTFFGAGIAHEPQMPLMGQEELDRDRDRTFVSAMYHAQLMSLFSQGKKVTAKMIRSITDDVDNEYQRLLESTSYLDGIPPAKADITRMRQSILDLSVECGNYLKKQYKD